MKLLSSGTVSRLKKRYNICLVLFLLLFALCFIGYIFSFYSNKLYISVISGIIAVLICCAYYFAVLFDKKKHLKLYSEIFSGITQSDIYTFKAFDGETETDGVKLKRISAEYTSDEGETYLRTLYLIASLHMPELSENKKYTFVTHRNIIIEAKDILN